MEAWVGALWRSGDPTSHLASPCWVHLQASSSPPGASWRVWEGHTLQIGAPLFREEGQGKETNKGTQNLRLIRVKVKYFIYQAVVRLKSERGSRGGGGGGATAPLEGTCPRLGTSVVVQLGGYWYHQDGARMLLKYPQCPGQQTSHKEGSLARAWQGREGA